MYVLPKVMSLLLPGKVLHLNALLAMRKFRDRGNKAGAVSGFEALEDSSLGRLICTKPHWGATMVSCTYFPESSQVTELMETCEAHRLDYPNP